MMDSKDEALCKIAVDALRAIQRTARGRHSDLWQLAIRRILDTKQQIERDDESVCGQAPITPAPAWDIGNKSLRFR